MQQHQIHTQTRYQSKKRVGRGGKRGTTSGHGTKGQKSRAGHRIRPQLRDILKKIPKKKGYSAFVMPRSIATVNLRDLEKHFVSGDKISPKILAEKGLVKRISGRFPSVKILGTGSITKNFIITNCTVSKTASEALAKSGSQILPKK